MEEAEGAKRNSVIAVSAVVEEAEGAKRAPKARGMHHYLGHGLIHSITKLAFSTITYHTWKEQNA